MLLCLAAGQVHAETNPPLTAEQTESLTRALRLWGIGSVASAADFTVSPADGHYDLRIPVRAPGSAPSETGAMDSGPITASVSPGADGRWDFADVTYPSPLRMAGPPGRDGTRGDVVVTAQTQTGHATVDPTLAHNSSFASTATGLRTLTSGKTPVAITAARASSQMEWVPASPGRVDIASAMRFDAVLGWTGATQGAPPPAGSKDSAGARSVTVLFQAGNADPGRLSELARRARAYAAGPLPSRGEKLSASQRAELHALLRLVLDAARDATFSATADGVAVASGDHPFNLDRVSMRGAAGAPNGKADIHWRLDLAGLALPDMPPGALRDLLPHHVVVAPFVTGATVADVAAIGDEIIDGRGIHDDVAGDAQGRLGTSPVTAGIEELSFDLGPAQLDAKGHVTASGPSSLDGRADIEATGLDALLRRASGDRLLKRMVPVVIFLKGIGQQEGEKTVWHVVFRGGKLTVNGTDISGFLPPR